MSQEENSVPEEQQREVEEDGTTSDAPSRDPSATFRSDKPDIRVGEDWTEIRVSDNVPSLNQGEGHDEPSAAGSDGGDSPADEGDRNGHLNEDDSADAVKRDETEGKDLPALPEEDGPSGHPPTPTAAERPPMASSVPSTATLSHASRARSASQSTTLTNGTQRTAPLSSTVFVNAALDTIANSKEARRNKDLGNAVQKAIANLKQGDPESPDPELIFRPLQLAANTSSIPLQTTALDCIGKLINYSYFAFPSSAPKQAPGKDEPLPLIERAIETICECFENEATPVEIQQQIIKSLLGAVLNDKIVVHGAGLLKAIRQIYNIFIYSKSSTNQQVAQGSLTQMVTTVFDRVKTRIAAKEARSQLYKLDLENTPENGSEDQLNGNGQADGDHMSDSGLLDKPAKKEGGEKLTLQSFETSKNLDEVLMHENTATTVTRARMGSKSSRNTSGQTPANGDRDEPDYTAEEDEDDIYMKDAFLVFRSLCKLSQKILSHDQQQDIRSQNMRTKLLSLHLLHNILNNHITIFTSPLATFKNSEKNSEPTSLVQAAKPHICLSLSRNASSSVPRVFDVCCEIFWLMMRDMRVSLKKELEVFLKEVYLAILERRTAPMFQKLSVMGILERLSADPRALVEVYLNYDCDRTALENIFQGVIEQLSRLSSSPVTVSPTQQQQYQEQQQGSATSPSDWQNRGTLLPSLSTSNLSNTPTQPPSIPVEYVLKQQSLSCLVEILSSLDSWSRQGVAETTALQTGMDQAPRLSADRSRESLDSHREAMDSVANIASQVPTGPSTPIVEDDPNELEREKHRKTALSNGIRQFNFKPKRGIKALINEGFIRSNAPEDIAMFLIRNDRLDKAMIGEYLGEGDDHNVAVMHAFVDSMEFAKRRFVDALRQFLQSFRLPGEAQKIDRFMIKFAARYIAGNPNAFANADTAYVLAYSVIMLNTDQHSVKMKGRRMTKEEFIKNNRGINDNKDLPDEYLGGIYDEIARNEIVLDTERENAAAQGLPTQTSAGGLASRAGQALATVGRDLQREKYAQASEEMANKTENLYRSLIRAQRKTSVKAALSKFIPATSYKHVGPMFDVTWMSFLSGLSGQVQDTQNLETIRLCMEGIKLAIRISCLFDLETPRVAFVTALAKFTNLGNLREMQAKNVEALKVLLEIALTEGDLLRGSWMEILTCISQLDRFQLLSGGIDEGVLPDVLKARIVSQSTLEPSSPRRSTQTPRRPRPQSTVSNYQSDVAIESRSSDMMKGVDKIFTNTEKLSGDAIVDFARALCHVSWQEIQSSGRSDSPRLYSLQKIVEVSAWNMKRVRYEWKQIWEILGDHFNQVGCHNNTIVVFFALDSLRQLSVRFMEEEEPPGFAFQKDFLKPFQYIMSNSSVVTVKDMILRCLIQMIQARGDNIRSGWKTMFGVFTAAAREEYEGIVNLAFDHVMHVYNSRFGTVISQGAFADLIVCLTEFSKNSRFQKKSLAAIETIKSTVYKMLHTPECPLAHRPANQQAPEQGGVSGSKQPTELTVEEQFWFPVLFGFHDVLMTGDDLEVRSQALNYLFDTLVSYGGQFTTDFWDTLWRKLLYPIFMVLKSKSEMSKVVNHEDLSVWLSTTMIQALRSMIKLFTHYFDSLEYMLDRFLDLLALCICQENDTIARIGSNCLQELILANVNKFDSMHWSKIVGAFVSLFERTTAVQLFSAAATSSHSAANRKDSNADSASLNGASLRDLPLDEDQAGEDHAKQAAAALKTNGMQLEDPTTPTQDSQTRKDSVASPTIDTETENSELEDYRPQSELQQQPIVVTAARRRFFNKIITKCVLQLLMIETVNELFSNDTVYTRIPSQELLRLMILLKKSYTFAKKFNGDKDLRMRLWREGFMKQPPNLLKQESGSAATYVSILFRMYHDDGEERKSNRGEIEAALIP